MSQSSKVIKNFGAVYTVAQENVQFIAGVGSGLLNVSDDVETVLVDTSIGDAHLVLPTTNVQRGKVITVFKVVNGHTVYVRSDEGNQFLNGQPNTLGSQIDFCRLMYAGDNYWFVLNQYQD